MRAIVPPTAVVRPAGQADGSSMSLVPRLILGAIGVGTVIFGSMWIADKLQESEKRYMAGRKQSFIRRFGVDPILY